jgi:hypothetical protein
MNLAINVLQLPDHRPGPGSGHQVSRARSSTASCRRQPTPLRHHRLVNCNFGTDPVPLDRAGTDMRWRFDAMRSPRSRAGRGGAPAGCRPVSGYYPVMGGPAAMPNLLEPSCHG